MKIKCQKIDVFFKTNKKSRLAIIVRKKENNATDRNKIKRRIREIYREQKTKKGDFVIKVKEKVEKITFFELKNQIELILKKIENTGKNE